LFWFDQPDWSFMTLFSYTIPIDDGAAPNPFGGVCTLTICKPAIRRKAAAGDWVVGLGSKRASRDFSGRVVYAMKITRVLTLQEYDEYCSSRLPIKLPDWTSARFEKRVGDCIYAYSGKGEPTMRAGIHHEGNRDVDLSGKNALLSTHFYYFGNKPQKLPAPLTPIIHQTQGHKSSANADYVVPFIEWVESLGYEKNVMRGEPQLRSAVMTHPAKCSGLCASSRSKDGCEDNLQDC
jgi:hypothetical protein